MTGRGAVATAAGARTWVTRVRQRPRDAVGEREVGARDAFARGDRHARGGSVGARGGGEGVRAGQHRGTEREQDDSHHHTHPADGSDRG